MNASDTEARKLKLFGAGALCGIVLAVIGSLIGFHVSSFESVVIVAASGFAAVALLK
ncbi:hypothetical protein ONR75_24115 [Rhodopseudomonas sp. P2A-2r]|uniref:hypothetical protein n=1 Tax=Rhodopseudomonas sp. P2A-2r TaxID=2991972 RepID=UPI002233EE58|nr:hypothetical protein [Rhodopseudomonas sp. P2A-2r]UZE47925.1 hypothetical protein ONR75_24115 [Rhodopseudomonas sp. P2A-2r]